jgi:hypothetical protein
VGDQDKSYLLQILDYRKGTRTEQNRHGGPRAAAAVAIWCGMRTPTTSTRTPHSLITVLFLTRAEPLRRDWKRSAATSAYAWLSHTATCVLLGLLSSIALKVCAHTVRPAGPDCTKLHLV